MASVYDNIRSALEVSLSAVAGVPQIAWENVKYVPTTGTPYLKPVLVPTLREPSVRGLNPQMLYRGFYTITCYVPQGNGPSVVDDLADSIIDAFEATTDITDGTTIVSIRYAERGLGVEDGAFYAVPVTIGWYHYS